MPGAGPARHSAVSAFTSSPVEPRLAPSSSGDVWNSIVQAAMEVYRHRAFHEVSRSAIAEQADLDLSVVLDHFPTAESLLLATVHVWEAQRMGPVLPLAERDGAVAFLRGIVLANLQDPALMRLLVATANIAATPGHPLAAVLQQQWVQFHATVQRALVHDVTVGREPVALDPADGAEQLIALYEGLQVQAMLRPNMDLLESYDRAVTCLRDGWSRGSTVWEV